MQRKSRPFGQETWLIFMFWTHHITCFKWSSELSRICLHREASISFNHNLNSQLKQTKTNFVPLSKIHIFFLYLQNSWLYPCLKRSNLAIPINWTNGTILFHISSIFFLTLSVTHTDSLLFFTKEKIISRIKEPP